MHNSINFSFILSDPCLSGIIPTEFVYVPPETLDGVYDFTVFPLLCINERYGSICNEGFASNSALVACREIGSIIGLEIIGMLSN